MEGDKIFQTFQIVCNIIILLGGVAAAITGILALIGKPFGFFKKRREQADNKRCEAMVAHVKEAVTNALKPMLEEIHQQNLEQMEDICKLTDAMKNNIGVQILTFYKTHKVTRTITESEKDAIEDLYKAYKSINGNHYVDQLYKRITTWTVVTEDGTKVEGVKWYKPWEEEK